MNAGRWNASLLEFRLDPLADPVMRAWDLMQRGESIESLEIDPADATLIAGLLASDRAPMPSFAFVDRLGQQLASVGAQEARYSSRLAPVPRSVISRESHIPRSGWHASWRPDRRLSPAIAALLIAILIGGLFVARWAASSAPGEPPPIPAVADQQSSLGPETFGAILSPAMAGLPAPDTWDVMAFNLLQLLPGERLDTRQGWFTFVDGFAVLQVESGSLQIDPGGSVQLFPASTSAQPLSLAAGSPVTLQIGDTVVYSVRDAAIVVNRSDLPAVALIGLAGESDPSVPGLFAPPAGANIQNQGSSWGDMPGIQADQVRLSIAQVPLRPHQTYVQAIGPTQAFLGLGIDAATQSRGTGLGFAQGDHAATPVDPDSFQRISTLDTTILDARSITLLNPLDEPIFIYLFGVDYLADPPSASRLEMGT